MGRPEIQAGAAELLRRHNLPDFLPPTLANYLTVTLFCPISGIRVEKWAYGGDVGGCPNDRQTCVN